MLDIRCRTALSAYTHDVQRCSACHFEPNVGAREPIVGSWSAHSHLVPRFRLDRLGQPEFAEYIRTDDISIGQVAERIAGSCGLNPKTDDESRGRVRRAWWASSTFGSEASPG